MKILASLIAVAVVFLADRPTMSQSPNKGRPAVECAQPVTLEIAPSATGGLSYKLAGKPYSGYPLDDLRKSLSGCKASRSLYVVIDHVVPAGEISSAVASKLQVDDVRYFIRYPEQEHMVVEIKIVGYDSRLP